MAGTSRLEQKIRLQKGEKIEMKQRKYFQKIISYGHLGDRKITNTKF